MCYHEQSIEDERTGDLICTDCGLVLDSLVSSFSNQCFSFENHSSQEITDEEKLRRCLDVLLIENHEIIRDSKKLLKSIRRRIQEEDIPFRFFNNKVHVCWAIWEACNINKCPRSLDEICLVCGVKESALLKLEKELNLRPTYCSPKDYVERISGNLGLPFWMQKCVKIILSSSYIYTDQYKPVNVVAGVIVALNRLRKSKPNDFEIEADSYLEYFINRATYEKNLTEFSVREVCTILGTASGVIYRIIRILSRERLISILNGEFLSEKKFD